MSEKFDAVIIGTGQSGPSLAARMTPPPAFAAEDQDPGLQHLVQVVQEEVGGQRRERAALWGALKAPNANALVSKTDRRLVRRSDSGACLERQERL